MYGLPPHEIHFGLFCSQKMESNNSNKNNEWTLPFETKQTK